jgi:hypothetical protein
MSETHGDARDRLHALNQMQESEGWRIVRESLVAIRDNLLRKIVSMDTPLENVPTLRGQLIFAEAILSRPVILVEQAKAEIEEREREESQATARHRVKEPRY